MLLLKHFRDSHLFRAWSLITVVLAVILMFFIVMPVLAFMYYDMYYATQAAVIEVRKMKELRKEIQIERMYSK